MLLTANFAVSCFAVGSSFSDSHFVDFSVYFSLFSVYLYSIDYLITKAHLLQSVYLFMSRKANFYVAAFFKAIT